MELTLHVIAPNLDSLITPGVLSQAAQDVERWSRLSAAHKVLSVVQDVLTAAPFVPGPGQSLLHIWTGIEALFPTVQQEVTFRVAVYLAQLYKGSQSKRDYYRQVKKAYDVRSKIAHGSMAEADITQWATAWQILIDACSAILERGKLPSEDEILAELFPT